MPTIEFKAETMKTYIGKDGESTINLFKGMRAKVSDEKCKQLLTDYPKDFEEVRDSEPKESQSKTKNKSSKDKK